MSRIKEIVFSFFVLAFLGFSLFGGCSTIDSGSNNDNNDDNSGTEPGKEDVKWEKVIKLERLNFNDDHLIDTTTVKNGWAVSGDTFWKLINGEWSKSNSYEISTFDSLELIDENNGWAVGNGTVFKLAGGDWVDYSSSYGGIFSAENYCISLVDINTGWAAGTGGNVLKLSGGSWFLENSGISDDFTAISLVDGDNGWGAVYKSSGNGNTFFKLANGIWENTGQVAIEYQIYVKKIILEDSDNGFAYGSKVWELDSKNWSVVGITNPGSGIGSRTSYLYVSRSDNGNFNGWALYDPDKGHDGDEKIEYFTYDGSSTTWDDSYTLPSGTLPVKIMNNDGNIWAICENGGVWMFDGTGWVLVLAGGGKMFNLSYGIGVDFIDINNGMLVGGTDGQSRTTVLKLINGNWSYAPIISHAQYFDAVSLSGSTDSGWAASKRLNHSEGDKAFGKLTNGKWELNSDVLLNYNDRIRAIVVIDENNGWAAGSTFDSQSQVFSDTFWKLENGVWTQGAQFASNHRPSFIQLYDLNNGWATGLDGTKWILQTGTWIQSPDRQGIAEVADLRDNRAMFYPVDENNGWGTYYPDDAEAEIHILKLINNEWTTVEEGIDIIGSPITAWAFEDMETGWIAVQQYIYKVKDGKVIEYGKDENGNTVESNFLDDSIYKIWLQDYKNGWAIGKEMTIYRLSPNE